MAEYTSTTMPNALSVKEALDRISQYVPASFVWIEIPEKYEVDLNFPMHCDLITGPGDYTIYKFKNGPAGVATTPINVNIRKSQTVESGWDIFVFDGLNSWLKEGEGNWAEAVIEDDTAMSIYRGSDAPSATDIYWLDTSHYDNGHGYIDLKYYNGTSWVSIFESAELMFTGTYDKRKLEEDIFQYVDDHITAVNAYVNEFKSHTANRLIIYHLDADKRLQYNTTLLTAEDVRDLLATIYITQLEKVVSDRIESNTSVDESAERTAEIGGKLDEHLAGHITEEDAARWDNKAQGNHTHNMDDRVSIKGEDIISGTFPMSQIPDEVKERYYQIASLDEFSDSTITDQDRKTKYHKGNAFYMDDVNEDGEPYVRWFRVQDPSKIGTPDYMQGLLEFTNVIQPVTWQNIVEKPTTLEGFKIDDEAYTKEETNTALAGPKAAYEELQEQYNFTQEMVDVSSENVIPDTILRVGIQKNTYKAVNFTDMGLKNGLGNLDIIVLTNHGVYKSTNYHMHSPGWSWVAIHIPSGTPAEYFSARFPSDYATDAENPNFGVEGCGRAFTVSSTPITTDLSEYGEYLGDRPLYMIMSNTKIIMRMTKYTALNDLCAIYIELNDSTRILDDALIAAYDKWGYPADEAGDTTGKQIEGTIPATVAQAVESIITMPELS